jgi:hypothetical protein
VIREVLNSKSSQLNTLLNQNDSNGHKVTKWKQQSEALAVHYLLHLTSHLHVTAPHQLHITGVNDSHEQMQEIVKPTTDNS